MDNRIRLRLALKNEDLDDLRTILRSGVDIDKERISGERLVEYVIRHRKWKSLELLLEHGANISWRNEKGRTPLHFAIEHKAYEAIELLIKYGADVNCRNDLGETPLKSALDENAHGAYKPLISAGADLNTRDNRNCRTLLHLAAKSGMTLFDFLLSHEIDVNATDAHGYTPLHIVCAFMDPALDASLRENEITHDYLEFIVELKRTNQRNGKFVKKLLCRGAKVNLEERIQRRTPLHLAMETCDVESVEYLLACEADLRKLDVKGRTPLESTNDSKMLRVVAEHLISRAVAGFVVESFHEEWIAKLNWDVEAHKQKCVEEIKRMKESKICANLNYYQFLRADRRSLMNFVKKLEIVLIFNVEPLNDRFPIYAKFLERNYSWGILYNPVLKPATESLNLILKQRLPSVPLYQILDHLDYDDMKNLIKAASTSS